MLLMLAKGKVKIGRGGTEEALQGRYDGGTTNPMLVMATEVELDDPSPHGAPLSQSWTQALVWYCACARVGGLVLAGSASAFAEWIRTHSTTDMPDGRLFALVDGRVIGVHTASARGAHSVADGRGCMLWPSGSYYTGQFQDDKRHGKGTHVLKSGEAYVGEWRGGKKTGSGKFTYTNGNVYDGQWLDNERHGDGTCVYPDGNKYVGQWTGGKRNGQGTFVFGKTGVRYVGEWRDEQMHGHGKLYEQNGKVIEGSWARGKKDGAFVTMWAGVPRVEKETWVDGQLTSFEEGTREVLLAQELQDAGLEEPHDPDVAQPEVEDTMAA